MSKKRKIIKKVPVVLLERIRKVGERNAVVSVKPGFFRNFLEKKGLAARYRTGYLSQNTNASTTVNSINYEEIAKKLHNKSLVFVRASSNLGILYGAVSINDILEQIKEKYEVELSTHNLRLSKDKIKKADVYDVFIDIGEKSIKMNLSVHNTEDRAKSQLEALGK